MRPSPALPLWCQGDTPATVAMRVYAQLSLGKARLVHAELGKLIKQTADIRREGSELSLR